MSRPAPLHAWTASTARNKVFKYPDRLCFSKECLAGNKPSMQAGNVDGMYRERYRRICRGINRTQERQGYTASKKVNRLCFSTLPCGLPSLAHHGAGYVCN